MKKALYFKNCNTLDEAKKEFKKLAMRLHPDRGGNESEFKEMLNQFQEFKPSSEKFKGESEQWNSEEFATIINELLKISDIEITVCGSWIWLSGDTKPSKELIKEIETGESYRRGWSKKKLMWYFSPSGYRKKGKELSFDKIKNLYGSEKIKSKRQMQLS